MRCISAQPVNCLPRRAYYTEYYTMLQWHASHESTVMKSKNDPKDTNILSCFRITLCLQCRYRHPKI